MENLILDLQPPERRKYIFDVWVTQSMIFCYGSWSRLKHVPQNEVSDDNKDINYRTQKKSKDYDLLTILTLLWLLPCLLPTRAAKSWLPNSSISPVYSTDRVVKAGEIKGHPGFKMLAAWDSLCSKYAQTRASHTIEINCKVKKFSLKIDLILFKLPMF